MKFSNLALAAAVGLTQTLEARAETVQGFDISNHQPTVDYKAAYADGARFVMIKVLRHSPHRSNHAVNIHRQPRAPATWTNLSTLITRAPLTPN
jgi:hypothetical protein